LLIDLLTSCCADVSPALSGFQAQPLYVALVIAAPMALALLVRGLISAAEHLLGHHGSGH
jgi:hypothetical protein